MAQQQVRQTSIIGLALSNSENPHEPAM